jgi:hypothetical protein
MIRLLRSNQPVIFFLIPLVALLLWMSSLIHPLPLMGEPASALSLFTVVSKFAGNSAFWSCFSGMLLTLISGYMLGRMNIKYIFIQERTQMPILFFILLAGVFPSLHQLNPIHCALPFIIVAIDRMIGTYRNDNLSYNPFEASILMAVASLFYAPAVFFLPMVWIGLLLFRPGMWREWFFSLAGFTVPYIFWFTWLLITNQSHHGFIDEFVSSLFTKNRISFSTMQLIFLGFLTFLLLLSSQLMIQKFQSKKILARRSFTLLFWIFILLIGCFFFIPSTGSELIAAASLPIAYLIAHFFMYVKKKWWGELLLWILGGMIVIIITQG